MKNFKFLGIDPGTEKSGYCLVDYDYKIINSDKIDNDKIIELVRDFCKAKNGIVIIESIQSYGMTMGKSTIETCYLIGRLKQICIDNKCEYKLIPRPEYGKAICATNKVSDALIRSALENRFGSYSKGKAEKKLKNGTIKQKFSLDGPLFLIAGENDKRSAYALCCYYIDNLKLLERGNSV